MADKDYALISVKVPAHTAKALKYLALENETTVSAITRTLFDKLLERNGISEVQQKQKTPSDVLFPTNSSLKLKNSIDEMRLSRKSARGALLH